MAEDEISDKKKILLVDDEVSLIEVMKFRLEEAGYEVITATDGFSAMSMARAQRPDIVLLDLMLPKLDGYTVCRMLKLSGVTKGIPIIILTARSSPCDRDRGLETGADAYMTKPIDIPSLLEKISELMKDRPKESESG